MKLYFDFAKIALDNFNSLFKGLSSNNMWWL